MYVRVRVVPGTDLAGYPANNFAGYRISGKIINIRFKKKNVFHKNYQHFRSLFHSYFILSEKVLKKVCSFEVRIDSLTGYPANQISGK